jgi:uncharacterized repeat protein (TIGR01451 family)
MGSGKSNGIEQNGPPWDGHENWNYRIPVTISSGTSLAWYQILVTLDDSNFNFNQAQPDGSDIRFTHTDGTTELSYWIESWNASTQLARIWVKVPGLASGDTTIYLYYDNPNATSTSNGSNTFDSFDDDWCDFPGAGCMPSMVSPTYKPLQDISSEFVWSIIGTTPSVTPTIPGYLNIWEGSGIKSTSTYLYRAIGYRANFGLGGEYLRGGFLNHTNGTGTMIGDDCSGMPGDLFLINSSNCTQFLPQGNWHNAFHVYEVRWVEGQSYGDIDHGNYAASSTVQVPNTSIPVTLYSYPGSKAKLTVDWVYVRQYRNPEPNILFGDAQGLVELVIECVDSPDRVKGGEEITYQLTISNSSDIPAPFVVVTNTLPAGVRFISAIPSQGSCNSEILCNLGTIPANSTAGITIIGQPQTDGIIINQAVVGSPNYELDLSDNISEQETLVDSVLPTVAWIEPVGKGGIFETSGGMVLLEATAADNDQIERVEFWLYHDGNPEPWENIAKIYSSPYQFLLDSDTLLPNQHYPVEAYAFDRAGNRSSLDDNLRQVIYIIRILTKPFYLPLIGK